MKYIFSMIFWVVVARWCYSEVAILCPEALPYIDKSLQVLQIPTHDKWEKLEGLVRSVPQELASGKTPTRTQQPRTKASLFELPPLESLDTQALADLLEEVDFSTAGRLPEVAPVKVNLVERY